MTLGGASVWTNFSYGNRIDAPIGWLLNPEGSKIILFMRNKKSSRHNLKVLVQTYYTNHLGEPNAIKSSSQLPLDKAWEKWHDLQLEGWTYENHELPLTLSSII
tara:strand:+ start:153 stop:464 length:312 start_codon:yes stop_codon:yes gene_type:complete